MNKIFCAIIFSLSFQIANDFSLEDINSTSQTFSENIGPSYFTDDVIFIYFGHFGWGTCGARFEQLNGVYDQLISNNILNVKLIGISKQQLSGSSVAWTENSDVPIVSDLINNPTWQAWGASNRDVFVLNPNQEVEYKVNMTSTLAYDINEIYSTIESLALDNQNIQMGDGNADGYINILDAVLIVQFILGNINLTNEQISIIDLNSDDTINVVDAIALITLILNE